MVKIVASILNAEYSKFSQWLPELEAAKIDKIQFDIMDNIFVPNLGVPKQSVAELRKKTKIPFESHLMVKNPESFLEEFSKNGTNTFIFHIEATEKPDDLIRKIKGCGLSSGIAINNKTNHESVFPYLDKVEVVLVMSVNAGFGGQVFNPKALEKIKSLRKKIDEQQLLCQIEVDGGINPKTAQKCIKAGADALVVGSFLFNHPNGIRTAMNEIRNKCN